MAPLFGTAKKPISAEPPKRGIRKRDVVAYALLPRILPRFGDLFFTGFYFFAFFMAQVYRGVRLLPEGHPCLNPANIGHFGVRDVITAATKHLVWKRENIDQILAYMAILIGLVLIVLQVATFIIAIAVPQASAASGLTSIFASYYPDQDIAFILLDRVFGVPGVFNSCVSIPSAICSGVEPTTLGFDDSNPVYKPNVFPWPFHNGLHALFSFYSVGLLLVGVFILIYYIIVIVAETAQTGTPFGKRFNTVWAPIRLVVAFGLLIPVANGLNSAQYITLYAAKWGSNFATNGWVEFNRAMGASAQGMAQNMYMTVKPKEPDVRGLLQFMTLAHECKVFAETVPTIVPVADPIKDCTDDGKGKKIEAYIVKPGFDTTNSKKFLRDLNYDEARKFSENNDIIIRFGNESCRKNYSMAGNIEPTCGELSLPINSVTEVGALTIQKGYYNLVKHLWGGYGSGTEIMSYRNDEIGGGKPAQAEACIPTNYNKVLNSGTGDPKIREYALSYYQNGVTDEKTGQCNKNEAVKYNTTYETLKPPPADWMDAATKNYSVGSEPASPETASIDTDTPPYNAYEGGSRSSPLIIRNILRQGVRDLNTALAAGKYTVSPENLQRGWATAGIWYNRIAEMNGAMIGAAWDIPAPTRYPEVMMRVLAQKKQSDQQVSPKDQFSPVLANGKEIVLEGNGRDYATAMNSTYNAWNVSRSVTPTGNVLADFVNVLFGMQGLFDLRYEQNSRAHPLAMLVGVGKGLIEASIRNMGLGLGSGLGSILTALTGIQPAAELVSAISSFFFMIATTTLTAGFILYYVIPFLPFLYFFFAVGNWLKGVFEAMVGVPLWALAHLRIDGNGLPGEAALNGYFMLFEIFLRPIVILFGFLASITIFAAMAAVLHEVFEIAVVNLTGSGSASGPSQAVDKFFYTVMYAVIMYIMALSSFKLIDLVPNQIMRWMGTSVSTFSDLQQNAAESLTQYTAVAGSQIASGLSGGLQQGMGALKGAAGAGAQAAKNLGK